MQQDTINNVHISSEKVLVTPSELKQQLPLSDSAYHYVLNARKTVADIVHKRDNRVLIVTDYARFTTLSQRRVRS